jgi:DNA processing protein
VSRGAASHETAALLALLALPGLSHAAMVRLLSRHGSALDALRALPHEAGPHVNDALHSDTVRTRVRRARSALRTCDIHVIPFTDALYPARLRARLDEHTPPVLFARGRLELLELRSVAVVGRRNASSYGLDMAREIAAGTARAGGCVVSGVARGIDAMAHAAALSAGGATVGVLGCGIDVYYPRENTQLQDRIAAEGLLLSEHLPGTPPLRHHFPHRNRVIAALSDVVVVVEAGARSGAVATANHAAAQGVRVVGVANAMNLPGVQGILPLFRDGAEVYTGLRDLLESTGLIAMGAEAPAAGCSEEPPPRHAEVWLATGTEPVHLDEIARAAGLGTTAALVALLELELDGRVRQLAGQHFTRCAPPL